MKDIKKRKNIDEQIIYLWNKHSTRLSNGNRLPLEIHITQVETYCAIKRPKKLNDYLRIYDENIHFLYALYKLSDKVHKEKHDKENIAFIILVARLINLSLSIRKLIMSGFEESSRIISRTFIETIEITLMTLMNNSFSLELHDVLIEEVNDSEFWKSNIAYGKSSRQIEKLLDLCGFNDDDRKGYMNHRKLLKDFLSKSVHSSLNTSIDSLYVPSLNKKGQFEVSLLGGQSNKSLAHLVSLINEIYYFSYFILFFIMRKDPPLIFENILKYKKESDTVFISYFVNLDLYTKNKRRFLNDWKVIDGKENV